MNNLRKCSDSHTVRYLTGEDQIEIPPYRRPWNNYIEVTGPGRNNLKGVEREVSFERDDGGYRRERFG